MEELFEVFTDRYSKEMNKIIHKSDDQRNAVNPVLFVFIGDKSIAASKKIYSNIRSDWDNGEGISFFNVFSEESIEGENVFNFNLSYDKEDFKHLRKSIYDKFYYESEVLIKLNKEIVKIKNRILEQGDAFSTFEKINIAVVTNAADELNILVPEITLLIRSKLMEHFLITACDLYVLIETKVQEERDEFYRNALAASFFKEMEYFQSSNFKFEKNIEVYDETRKLTVKWNKQPFQLVYILSDVNRKGIVSKNSLEENYNIISYISLIKNRKINSESYYDIKNTIYSDAHFKTGISNGKEEFVISTAGLAVIERPNCAVAMAVLSSVYEDMLKVMKDTSGIREEEVLRSLELDEEALQKRVEEIFPKDKSAEDMFSIMPSGSILKSGSVTLREEEKSLYGDMCEKFYEANFKNPIEKKLKDINFGSKLKEALDKFARDKSFGLYAAYICTKEDEIVDTLKERIKGLESSIEKLEGEIEEAYRKEIKSPSFFKTVLGKGEIIRDIKNQIFRGIYERKIEALKIKLNIDYLKCCINELLNLREYFEELIKALMLEKEKVQGLTQRLIEENDNYIGKNIKEYYGRLVEKKLASLKEKLGQRFYFEERFVGNVYELMLKDKKYITKSLEEICLKYILTGEEFSKAFEDELNERTNLSNVDYNREISTKDEIFKNLCTILEDNSVPKAFIIDYNVSMHEEKYFFGDYSSDFIRYAYAFDKKAKSCEIGYIHEKRAAGIEKLSLLGGFKVKDLIYYKNSLKYYEACLKEGYELHG